MVKSLNLQDYEEDIMRIVGTFQGMSIICEAKSVDETSLTEIEGWDISIGEEGSEEPLAEEFCDADSGRVAFIRAISICVRLIA